MRWPKLSEVDLNQYASKIHVPPLIVEPSSAFLLSGALGALYALLLLQSSQ